MDIQITKPYQIGISIIEIEEYWPAFKVSLSILINHPEGQSMYETAIWLRDEDWDNFRNQLNDFKQFRTDVAMLRDLDDDVEIKIYRDAVSMYFAVNMKSGVPNGKAVLNITDAIDEDVLSHIHNKIME